MKKSVFLLFLIILWSCGFSEQSSEIAPTSADYQSTDTYGSLSLKTESDSCFFTDILSLKLTSDLENAVLVKEDVPESGGKWGDFEVFDISFLNKNTILIRLVPLNTGELSLSPLRIRVQGEEGEIPYILPRIPVTVHTSLVNDSGEPFGPEKKVKKEKANLFWIIPIILVCSIGGIWIFLKKRKAPTDLQTSPGFSEILSSVEDLSHKEADKQQYFLLYEYLRDGIALSLGDSYPGIDPAELNWLLKEKDFSPVISSDSLESLLARMEIIIFSSPGNTLDSEVYRTDCDLVRSILQSLIDKEERTC